jgi:hypothetical protein
MYKRLLAPEKKVELQKIKFKATEMSKNENVKPYRDRIQNFVTDPDLKALDKKYEPYLDIHEIEILDTFDIIQNPSDKPITGKLIWNRDFDYPTELKRDIILLYNRHFIDL